MSLTKHGHQWSTLAIVRKIYVRRIQTEGALVNDMIKWGGTHLDRSTNSIIMQI